MNEENISASKTEKSFLRKFIKLFSRNPSSSDEVADMLRSAENESGKCDRQGNKGNEKK